MAEPTELDDAHWAIVGARAADDKKGADTVILDVGDVLAITGYFVVTSGTNSRQVRSIAEDVEQQISAAGGPKPVRMEGRDDATWVLVDYGSFVVHVFLDETRTYYDLERLWADVPRVPWKADGSDVAPATATTTESL